MRTNALAALIAGSSLLAACAARADVNGRYQIPGSLVDLRVRVDGQATPLYPAPDGSGRYYLEARRGGRYELEVTNHTGARLGVLLAVDGLNVVSGERELPSAGPGRMYVLGAWENVVVRGWRSSMEDVRQFTFVDEQASYSARVNKANAKMGWIEVAVYRERPRPEVYQPWRDESRGRLDAPEKAESSTADKRAAAPADQEAARGLGYTAPGAAPAPTMAPPATESFPGTGWGDRRRDPVVTVQFDPQARPAETLGVRYEYRSALVRLGVLPSWPPRDRLAERESGREGFAPPPLR